jgi:hypothetical protein
MAWQTYVSSGDRFYGVQDYCHQCQLQTGGWGLSFLTVALFLNRRHHLGVFQILGSTEWVFAVATYRTIEYASLELGTGP